MFLASSPAGDGRRKDARLPWPGTDGSLSKISVPSRRGKHLKTQTDSGSLDDLMNLIATRMESRPGNDEVHAESTFILGIIRLTSQTVRLPPRF